MTQPIPKSIALIDFSHCLVVNFKGRANDSGPNDAGQATLNQLSAIAQTVERVVVCLDKKPYWRTEIYPEYKAGRVREPELVNIWSWTMERLAADGYQMAHSPGEEADDICATLAREYASLGCTDVRIVTQDKDVSQCITDKVRVFSPVQGKSGEFEIRDTNWLQAKFEVSPGNFPMLLSIMGDQSDNIPGIKGLGQKTGANLINRYKTFGGIAEACVRAVEAAQLADEKLPSFWQKYAAGMTQLPTWLQLVTLNANAKLNKTPLELLEKLTPQNLVSEDADDLADIERLELSDADGDAWAPDADELAVEAAAMTDATGAPAMVDDGAAMVRRAEETAARVLEENRARFQAERERVADVVQQTPGAGKANKDRAAALEMADQIISPTKAAPIIGKDPGADAAMTKLAEENKLREANRVPPKSAPAPASGAPTAAAAAEPAASVVPATRGPAKPRQGDEIQQSEALARVPVAAPTWALAAQPQTANEMLSIAKVLFNSRFYSQFGSERGVFAVMTLGRELGMGFAESLESFHIVKDRPFPKAKWILSRMQAHPDCEWCIVTQGDDKACTIKMKHRKMPDVLSFTYTIEQAIAAGHTTGPNRHNWEKNTRSMLRARAISGASGDWMPGATFALHSSEEMADHG